MSSTQMDFSPQIIDRKQDITSWPEGDVDKLTTRDKNRYQKRKSAIIEYFQSDLSIEEISSRLGLPSSDTLETLAERCCMFHEDGQPWGFRALVPGARVVNYVRSDSPGSVETQDVSSDKESAVERPAFQDSAENARGADTEDTAQRRAIKLTDIANLPQTPVPEILAGKDEPPTRETEVDLSAESISGEEISVVSAEATKTDRAKVEEVQEGFASEANEAGGLANAEVEQEEFPIAASVTQIIADAEVEQEEFPLPASVIQILDDAEVEQEEFPAATNATDTPDALEEKQEELAETTIEVEEPEELEEEQVEIAEAESEGGAPEDVKGEQEDFLTAEGIAQAVSEVEASEDLETLGEPTGNLGDLQHSELAETREAAGEEVEELAEVENAKTQELAAKEPGEAAETLEAAGEEAEELAGAENVKTQELTASVEIVETREPVAEESDELVGEEDVKTQDLATQVSDTKAVEGTLVDDESTVVAEMDTVEVARIEADERLDRVAATNTIKVPAALLEALEKDEQELLAKTEPAPASIPAAEKDEADHPVAVPPELSAREDTQPASGDTLAGDEIEASPTQRLEVRRRDSRQLSQAQSWKTPSQSLTEESRYRITGSQAAIKHSVLRRWGKQGREQKYRRWVRIVSAAVIVSLLVILLIPLGVGLAGYSTYTNIKSVANDGVSNLLAIKSLMPANKNDITSVLNTQKLTQAKTSLAKAQSDFLQLQDMVNRPDVQSLLQQFAPQYSGELDQARRLVQVALDVSQMGQELIGVAQVGANILHGGALLSTSAKTPLLSADNVNTVEAAITHAQYYINDIQTQMSQVNLNTLPLGNKTQKAELAKYLGDIPQIQSLVSQAQSLVGPVAWMLGIGQARHLLVQTLDRGELRPSGGFEGQYGVLTLQDGRMSPFSLKDITLLDYAENGAELGATPPSQYGWMNFGNFGVRDANLSADFPTTAQIVMKYYQQEGGGPVDGIIQITPVVIEQFLQVTGPIQIPEYHDTVTAQNLESKLHAYQQDPRLITLQQEKTGKDSKSTRKAFTNLVGTLLMDRIKHLPLAQMMDFGKILLKDLKSRDLQVYLDNPVAEQWLTQNGDSGAMPQFANGTDGFMVVQANISISKAAQYVKSTFNDQVTLDSSGGATHNLTISLNYQQKGPVYGYNTYADYLRVYAPANAQLRSAYGFNTGATLCTPGGPKIKPPTGGGKGSTNTGTTSTGSGSSSGGSYTDAGVTVSGCGQYYYSYPDSDARSCPGGNYQLGYDGMAAKPWTVQALGGPSSMHSDLPGYAMWGGLTLTPKNCTSTITLSWYVPHAGQNTPGKAPYQMIVGHQAGWPDVAKVSINGKAWKGGKSLSYNQTITVDTLIALPALPLPQQPKPGNTPTPAVTPTTTPKKP